MMRKVIECIRSWRDQKDETLRQRLDNLSPKQKLVTVLVMFTVFAGCALFMFGTAIYHLGQDNGRRIEIEHIRQLDIRQKQDNINPLKQFEYGTEQEPYQTGIHGEAGEETETTDRGATPQA